MYMILFKDANPPKHVATYKGTKRQLLGVLIDRYGAKTRKNAVQEVAETAPWIEANLFRSEESAVLFIRGMNRQYTRSWRLDTIEL